MWLDQHNRRRLGVTEYVYSITLHGLWVLVETCTQVGASWQRSKRLELVEANMVEGSLTYYQHDNGGDHTTIASGYLTGGLPHVTSGLPHVSRGTLVAGPHVVG